MSAFDPLPSPPSAIPRALAVGARVEGIEVGPAIAEDGATLTYRATGARGEFLALTEYLPPQLALREPDGAVLPVAETAYRAGLAAFLDEARALQRADHPALLGVIDVFETRGTAYRTSRWLDGTRLVDIRRQMSEPPDEEALRDLLEALLGGLNAWQREAGVHGAVTPANILLLANDRPVLLGPNKAAQAIASDRVATLMTSVEPSFAPPEQIAPSADVPLGPTADYYALAGVIRYCLSGQLPPPALGGPPPGRESMRDLARRVRQSWPKLHYGEALLDTLEAALSHRPQDRPQSVAQFRAWLNTGPDALAQPSPPAAAHAPSRAAAPGEPITIDPIAVEPPRTPVPPSPRARRAAPPPARPPQSDPLGGFATLGTIPAPERDSEPVVSFFGIEPDEHHTDHFERFDRIDHDVRRSTTPARPPKRRRWGLLTATAVVALLVLGAAVGVREFERRREADRTLEIARGAIGTSPPAASAPPVAIARPTPAPKAVTPPLELPTEPTAAGPAATPPPPAQVTAPIAAAPAPPDTTATTNAPAAPARTAAPAAVVPAAPTATAAPAAIAPAAKTPPASTVPTVRVNPPPTAAVPPPAPPPRVAAAPRPAPAPTSPREVCGPRTDFSLYRCMTQQCAMQQWRFHAQCERLRRFDRVD